MAHPLQLFVLTTDGNLWLETAPLTTASQTRVQIDANVSNLYSQVGENRIWRTSFQGINAGEVFVLGNDSNLWLEHAPFNSVPPSRLQVDANVETFQAIDLGSVFVLDNNGSLWFQTAPFGKIPPLHRLIDDNVLAFQALDLNTVFVLGQDGDLWLETPFRNASRTLVDVNVIQFWAMDLNTVYVLDGDLNLWYETGPFDDVYVTIANRSQVMGLINDFQPLRLAPEVGGSPSQGSNADLVFLLDHDGNLWWVQGPYRGTSDTIHRRKFVDGNIMAFGAMNQSNIFVIDGNFDLWFEFSPFGPHSRQIVDVNVAACQPLYTSKHFLSMHQASLPRSKTFQRTPGIRQP